MGGTLILFDTCVDSGHFCFKFLNYIIFGGFRNINIFGGMKICGYFFFFGGGGGSRQIGLVLGVSSMYFRVFSYGKYTE